MGPSAESCVELLRPLRALLSLRSAVAHQISADVVPYAAFGLLAELVHRGECRSCDLAAHRIVDASAVSRQVAQLEQAELITRRPDPSDRRVALLRPTEQGQQAMAMSEQRNGEFLSEALRGWDEEDIRRLAALLRAVTADIRQAWNGPEKTGWGNELDDTTGSEDNVGSAREHQRHGQRRADDPSAGAQGDDRSDARAAGGDPEFHDRVERATPHHR